MSDTTTETKTHIFPISVEKLLSENNQVAMYMTLHDSMYEQGIMHVAGGPTYEAIDAYTDDEGINWISFKATYIPM